WTSKIAHDLDNEFNPSFTQKKKVSSVKIQYNENDLGTGADGAITINAGTGNKNIDTDNVISGRSCTDGGDAVNYSVTQLTSTTATLSTSPSSNCLAVGNEILLINLQGTISTQVNTGNYETLKIQGISSNVITFTTAKSNYYGDNSNDDTNIGTTSSTQIVMLQRVPNYTNVTIDSELTFSPSIWNGIKGGVMFFRATGTVSVGGTINGQGRGYDGGPTTSPPNKPGIQGESYNLDSTTRSTSANLGGGGGGDPVGNGEGGGGGGGYGTMGSNGGGPVSTGVVGAGGNSYGSSDLSKLYFGSGGGAGSHDIDANDGSGGAGGRAGGIIYISANTLSISGSLTARGNNGANAVTGTGNETAGGGGGSGGSIKLVGNTLTLGTNLITATGGTGGTSVTGNSNGGTGGVGRIAVYYANTVTGTASPTYYLASTPSYNYSLFISDEVPTPNATLYSKIRWLADLQSYGMVQFQTRSGKSNNSTDGTWEAWRPVVANTNVRTLQNMNTPGDWTATNLNTPADGQLARNVDYYEDEDIANSANLSTRFGSVGATNGFAEATVSPANLSNFDYLTAWVYATASGNLVKFGFGESAGTENEKTFQIDSSNTWQKVYWNITDIDESLRDAVTKLRVTILAQNTTLYVDNITADRYLKNSDGSTISSTPNEYIQYRAVLTSTNAGYRPKLHNVNIEWGNGFKIEQTNANTVRLYNFSGETQQLRLDAVVFGADLAEWYTVNDESIGPGDLVSITGEMDEFGVPILRKTDRINDPQLIGAISTKAGKALGVEAPNRRLLALAGRIPVKIDPTSAQINAGDYLTS
ncbi:MAG: hypothetical protein Q8M92_09755, partial [Candidatus Subteraquimicrobiales bacterium]|nr:hypothetical protein [Candidatus Subteraquimicrobiales bacterium]